MQLGGFGLELPKGAAGLEYQTGTRALQQGAKRVRLPFGTAPLEITLTLEMMKSFKGGGQLGAAAAIRTRDEMFRPRSGNGKREKWTQAPSRLIRSLDGSLDLVGCGERERVGEG